MADTIEFTPDELKEFGLEEVNSKEDVTAFIKTLKEKKPEVIEKPYEFPDEYIQGAVDYYKNHGTLEPFIKGNYDYDSVPTEQLIREDIKRQNQGISDRALDVLVKQELDQYKVADDASEDDKLVKDELLKVRANKIRNQLKEESKKFLAPDKPSKKVEEWVDEVNSSNVTKQIKESKGIKITDGDDEFVYEVEAPDKLVETTIDNEKFFNLFKGDDGKLNLDKWYKVLAYAMNPENFEKVLIGHGKSKGTESVVKDIKNPQRNIQGIERSEVASLLQAFAERGAAK